MVERDRSQQSLLGEVAERRRKKQSEKEAQELAPELKARLGKLIAEKVPPPNVVEVASFEALFSNGFEFERSEREMMNTRLAATIPSEDGGILVTISASGYPKDGTPESAMRLNYQIDLDELHFVLIVSGSEVKVQSKHWETEPFTMHTPTGVPLPTWPSWSRSATLEDLQAYQSLLDDLEKEGVTFEGSTPPTKKLKLKEAQGLKRKSKKR